MADGGWHSIAQVARLYGRSWKWVQNQVKRHNISTEKRGNQRVLRLVDFIAQMGEPPTNSTNEADVGQSDQSETVTTDAQIESALLKQENQFLKEKIGELEADRLERQAREARWEEERTRLEGIIERQTYALPKPTDKRGVFSPYLHHNLLVLSSPSLVYHRGIPHSPVPPQQLRSPSLFHVYQPPQVYDR